MKIGLVCPYNLFKGGGVQECVFAMQTELSVRGHEALIITPQPRDYSGDVDTFVRLLGRSTDMRSPFHTTAQISVSVDTKAVDALLDAEDFDILHFHEPWVPLLSWQILPRSKALNIATFHAKLPDTVMSKTIERVITPYTKSVLKYLDTLTAVSEPAASYVRSLTDREITIIPNGIDLKRYKGPGDEASRDKNMILYIGRLERRKGIKNLIEAVDVLAASKPDIRLIIAGAGPDLKKLENYVEELDAPVEFLGRVDEATKTKLLNTAQVFCSPAKFGESFGIVLLEAMASNLPVVAGDNPGYRTVMQGAGRLSLVDPSDTNELARQLDIMMSEKAVRKIWQDWAQKNVKKYSYTKIVDQYEAIYQQA
ncbi:MAG: glycosyltransferase family 4 protein [Patescibacteria group bacterium]